MKPEEITLEQALAEIDRLEKENAALRLAEMDEIEEYIFKGNNMLLLMEDDECRRVFYNNKEVFVSHYIKISQNFFDGVKSILEEMS